MTEPMGMNLFYCIFPPPRESEFPQRKKKKEEKKELPPCLRLDILILLQVV